MTRDEWSLSQPICWMCTRQACDTHEIARGPAKQAAMLEPAAWIRACRRCHDELDDYAIWPIERQLALKRLCDPVNYSRRIVNRLRGRMPNAISKREVDRALPSVILLLVERGVPLHVIRHQLDWCENQGG